MKFGKFELSDWFIAGLFLTILLCIVLHFTLEEERLKEETKQLELKKEIIILEKENNYERSNNN